MRCRHCGDKLKGGFVGIGSKCINPNCIDFYCEEIKEHGIIGKKINSADYKECSTISDDANKAMQDLKKVAKKWTCKDKKQNDIITAMDDFLVSEDQWCISGELEPPHTQCLSASIDYFMPDQNCKLSIQAILIKLKKMLFEDYHVATMSRICGCRPVDFEINSVRDSFSDEAGDKKFFDINYNIHVLDDTKIVHSINKSLFIPISHIENLPMEEYMRQIDLDDAHGIISEYTCGEIIKQVKEFKDEKAREKRIRRYNISG